MKTSVSVKYLVSYNLWKLFAELAPDPFKLNYFDIFVKLEQLIGKTTTKTCLTW